MSELSKIVRLRVLLTFLQTNHTCTVTGISRTLNINKQTVSRIIMELEKEGFIDRNDIRHPKLTKLGEEQAKMYAEKIHISMNHLMYEGVSIENARHDSYFWALFNSENTMNMIRCCEKKCRLKYELRNEKKITGSQLMKLFDHDDYCFPFVIYHENIKDGTLVSCLNDAFEHPCMLSIKNKNGLIELRSISFFLKLDFNQEDQKAKVQSIQYFDHGDYINAEKSGDIFSIPITAFSFINLGQDTTQVLHGTIHLRLMYQIDNGIEIESTDVFTILI